MSEQQHLEIARSYPESFLGGRLARWREKEAALIEGNALLRRFANPPRLLLAAVMVLAVLARLASLFAIEPGNAPDEFGHIVIAAALSQPEILTLESEHKYSAYPYSIYNPTAYVFPSLSLYIGSKVDPQINRMSIPMVISDRETYVARFGMLAWAAVFLVFLALSARLHFDADAWLLVGVCGLLPQLTFVQTYVNLDSMGVAAFALLIWALSRESPAGIMAAMALMANAKLNFIGTLALPFVCFVFWYWPKIGVFLKKSTLLLGLPILTALPWYVWNYYANTRVYGSFLGFSSLMTIYGDTPGGSAVFAKDFWKTTLGSAFAYFGYMSPSLPYVYYKTWFRIFMLGVACLIVCVIFARSRRQRIMWNLGLFFVLSINIGLHYWASYKNTLQPQGRYIFPAVLISLVYTVVMLRWVSGNFSRLLGQALKYALLLFFIVAAGRSLLACRTEPNSLGFHNNLIPIIAQDIATDSIERFTEGSYIMQSFTAQHAVLKGIDIPVSTERRGKAHEHIELELLDDRGEVLRKYDRTTNAFSKEATLFFPLWDLKVEPGKRYSLVMRGTGKWSEEGGVTFHRSNTDAYPDGALYLDARGPEVPYDLAFRVY